MLTRRIIGLTVTLLAAAGCSGTGHVLPYPASGRAVPFRAASSGTSTASDPGPNVCRDGCCETSPPLENLPEDDFTVQ